jgi:hypothetical protein
VAVVRWRCGRNVLFAVGNRLCVVIKNLASDSSWPPTLLRQLRECSLGQFVGEQRHLVGRQTWFWHFFLSDRRAFYYGVGWYMSVEGNVRLRRWHFTSCEAQNGTIIYGSHHELFGKHTSMVGLAWDTAVSSVRTHEFLWGFLSFMFSSNTRRLSSVLLYLEVEVFLYRSICRYSYTWN